ncbi:MAG: hypothetical protein SCH71_00240 [Desulfobulbaceae bacterium]|nr:hypothetical protein [Desulfobulbaceae bacterium]
MLKNLPRLFLAMNFFLFFAWSGPPSAVFADELTGGITFSGEREGVCVLIEGEYIEESIYFKLDTCDENREIKEQYRDRTPFTILVPQGEHRLIIMKEGEKVISDRIEIKPEKILEYRLP